MPSPKSKRATIANSNARPPRQKAGRNSTQQEFWPAGAALPGTALEEGVAKEIGNPLAPPPQQEEAELGSSDTKHTSNAVENIPGLEDAMTQIIHNGEATENQHASSSANEARMTKSGGTFPVRPNLQFRIQSLPILDNLVGVLVEG